LLCAAVSWVTAAQSNRDNRLRGAVYPRVTTETLATGATLCGSFE